MIEAPMGLDLVGEDTATNQLEERVAERTGELEEANERLLKAIISAATESRADTQTYSSDGALRQDGKGKSEGVSLALNQEL